MERMLVLISSLYEFIGRFYRLQMILFLQKSTFKEIEIRKINFDNLFSGVGISVRPFHILLTMLLVLYTFLSHAQQIQAGTGAPTLPFEVANGPRAFTVTITGGAVSSGSLVITLPTGYQYVPGSAVPSGGLTITQTSVSGNTATLQLTGIPATGINTTFTYQALATCEAIGVTGNQASYLLTLTGDSAQPERQSNSFNLRNAKLNITNLANAPTTAGVVGSNYTRTYRINNNGFGNIDTLYVTDVSGNGVTHLSHSVSATNNGATVTVALLSSAVSGTNTTYIYRFIISGTAQDNHLGQNEYFTFTQNLRIGNCTDLNTSLNAWFGQSPNASPCVPQNGTQTSSLTLDNSKAPSLNITFLSKEDLTCAPASGWITASVANGGNGTATNVSLRFGMPIFSQLLDTGNVSFNGLYANVWIDETNGVQYSTNGGTTWNAATYTTSSTITNAANSAALGKHLDVIVAPPDIASGQTIQIRFKRRIVCKDECNSTALFFRRIALLSGSYENSCGGSYVINYNQYLNDGSARGNHVPEMEKDAVGGQSYWVSYKTTEWLVPGANWAAGLIGSGGYTEMVVSLPSCFVPVLSTLTISDITGQNLVTPDMTFTDAQGVHIRFNLPTTSSTAVDISNRIVRFRTTVNCSTACPSPAITSKITFRQSSSCACTHVLGCTTWNPIVHCSTCSVPLGIRNLTSTATRLNIGQPDNDNNGVADAAGANYPSKVKTKYFTVGDKIRTTAKGVVVGTGSFDYAYLSIVAPDKPNLNVVSGSARAVIYDASKTTTYTANGLPVSGTYPNLLVDIGKEALTTAGVPSTFSFQNGDSLTVSLTYDYPITGNINFFSALTGANSVFFETRAVQFNHLLYGGTTALPTGSGQLYCDVPYTSVMHHHTVNWGLLNYSRRLNYNGCLVDDPGSGAGLTLISEIDNASANRVRNAIFPYEINPLVQLKEYILPVPTGLEVTAVRFSISNFTPTIITRTAPDAINGSNYHYDLQKLFDEVRGTTGAVVDEGFSVSITPLLRATCEATGSGNLPGQITYTYATETTVRNMAITWPYTITSQGNLNVVASQPVKTVTGNTVSWEVQISNSGNVAAIPNVWIAKNLAGGGTTNIQSVQRLATSGATSGTNVSATGDIYRLGNIAASSSQYYLVTATFSDCTKDSLQLAYGWHCSTYPTTVQGAKCVNNLTLSVIPTAANLQVSLLKQPTPTNADGTVDLCQELEYVAEVKNPAQGTGYALKFIVNKPMGISYVTNSYQLSPTILPTAATLTTVNNDATYVSETANSITFTIPASVAANLPYNRGYTIRYKIKTTGCSFVSGTKISVVAQGKNGCNSVINGTQQQAQPIRIKGEKTNANRYTFMSSISNDVDACGPSPVTYIFNVKNEGGAATYADESIRITVPKPFTLGAITGISNFSSATAPTVTSNATGTTYVWTMPLGVPVNESVSFSAPLTGPSAEVMALACDSLPIQEFITYTFSSSCVPSGPVCQGILQIEGENQTNINVNRPRLKITGFTAGTPSTNNVLEGTVTVSNAGGGTSSLPQTGTIKVYRDANSDGAINGGDVLIGSTTVTIGALTTPQVFNYSMASSYLGDLCPAIVTLEVACNCSDQITNQYTCNIELPVELQTFDVRKVELGVLLNWSTITETNSDYFEIQHSVDSKSWRGLGTLKAAGDTKLKNKYSFDHDKPANGMNYYRLKIVDRDNTFGYSRIRAIKTDNGIGVYPNPVTESLMLNVSDLRDIASVEIVNVKGIRVYKTEQFSGNPINVERLVPGVYIVKVTQASGVVTLHKIVKK